MGSELSSVVGLDHLDSEGQFGEEIVEELDGGLLVAFRVDAQHPEPGAVVDGGELVETFPSPSDRGDELDVDLDGVAGLEFLIAFPPFLIGLVFLGDGQPVQVDVEGSATHPNRKW